MSKEAPNASSSLEDFKFDDEEVFFGINPSGEEDEVEQVVKSVKEEDEPESGKDGSEGKEKDPKEGKSSDTEVEEEEEEEEEFFGEKTNKNSEDEGGLEAEPEAEPEVSATFKLLKEANIFEHIEISKDTVISKETLPELIDEEVEGRVTETFEAFFEELDEEGKQFLDFKRKGGKTSEWMATIPENYNIEVLDVEDEKQVDKTLRHYIKTYEGLEEAEIDDRIAWLKEKGKDRIYAQKYHNEIVEDTKKAREELLEKQNKLQKTRAEKAEEFKTELQKISNEVTDLNGVAVTKAEMKEITTSLVKPSVKVGKNKFVTEFQAKLAKVLKAETPEDKKNLLLLAKLAKEDFKLSGVEKGVETAVVKKIRNRVEAGKNDTRASSSGSRSRSLTDYF